MRAVLGAKCYTEFSFFPVRLLYFFSGTPLNILLADILKELRTMIIGVRSNFVVRSEHFDR